jgi:NADH:ubiquinone oxidoreductase subunit 2 (subunit N)
VVILGLGLLLVYVVVIVLPGALNSLVTRLKTHFVSRVSLLVIGAWLLFLLDCLTVANNLGLTLMDGLLKVTGNLLTYEVLLMVAAFVIIVVQGVYAKRPELSLIALPNLIGIVSLFSSNDWLVTVTGWELFNLSIYLLVGMNSYQGATIKYFIVSALTTTFLLLAVALLYALTGSAHYDSVVLGMTMELGTVHVEYLLIPLLFKLGAAPLHNWAPDLYDSLSFPLVLWIILIPKLAVIGLLMQISDQLSLAMSSFAVIGVISLVGSVGLSSQWRIKRFLAYSAISNLGFLLITLGTMQLDSYLYYITIYAITFLVQGVILSTGVQFVTGLVNLNLPLAVAWALSLFSLAGIPPLAGFYAKLLVLYSLLTIESDIVPTHNSLLRWAPPTAT